MSYKVTQTQSIIFSDCKEISQAKWFYSYSYQYSWIKKPINKLKYFRFDRINQVFLNSEKLEILYENRKSNFSLQYLDRVELNFRRLVFPMIFGGMIAPLFLTAAYSSVVNFWIGITICLVGVMLFYYGFLGIYQLSIFASGVEKRFALDTKTPDLEDFVLFINKMIQKRKSDLQ